MTTRDPAKQLAKELADLRKEVRSGSSASQMRFRALEGGAIPVYDNDGTLRGQIGQLSDGTTGFAALNGPTPTRPSNPIVFPLVGGLDVEWNGETFDGSPLPGDFKCLEVHASTYSVYTPDATTIRANLIRKGSLTLALPSGGPWTVTFVIRTTSDVLSEPSLGVTETPEHAPTEAEITDLRELAQGAETAAQTAQAKALEAAGIAASKGKILFQPQAPDGDNTVLWIDTTVINGSPGNVPKRYNGTAWVAVTDKTALDAAAAAATANAAAAQALSAAQSATSKANDALASAEAAQTTANGRNRAFWRASNNPPPAPLITGDLWFVTDQDNKARIYSGGQWNDATFGDGAIANLNVGKLTTGQLNVGQRIIAGLSTGTHAEMRDTGFYVFAEDPVDGIPNEVVRMGTETNDFIGIVAADGTLLSSLDEDGGVNAKRVNTDTLTVGGRDVSTMLADGPRGVIDRFYARPGFDVGPLYGDFGIAELGVPMYKDRTYRISWRATFKTAVAGDEVVFLLRRESGTDGDLTTQAPKPTVSSASYRQWWRIGNPSHPAQHIASGETTIVPARTTRYRWLLSCRRGPIGSLYDTFYIINDDVEITIEDIGPAKAPSGNFSNGGGTAAAGATTTSNPPSTSQQYVWEAGPAGRASYTGSGQLMNWAGNDVYQGYHGSNGDTRGQFWFNLPNITGTVDRVDLYLYFRHWYYNAGGTAILNISDQRGVGPNPYKFRGDWHVGGWPKPGGRWVTVPGDWFAQFKGTNNDNFNGRATCITLGPGGGTNQLYYGVATDARLKIWYTQ